MLKQKLLNLSYSELVQYLESIGEKSFRAAQIFEWIYQCGGGPKCQPVTCFDGMKNLPQGLRDKLKKQFGDNVGTLHCNVRNVSTDGTAKFLFSLADGEKIETVLIPTAKRNTVCVSTQVGCKFACEFCASGIGGFKRNLTTGEILSQILAVKNSVRTLQSSVPAQSITHIVFMGIGEPLDNYDNVLKAVRIINDKNGLCIGARRITLSTCGIIPKIKQLAQENLQFELAISLHGYNDESRNKLVPINKKYPFNELLKACRGYIKTTNRQITFEYVLIKDFTCAKSAAIQLSKSLKGMLCKMNLIPYNEIKKFPYQAPSKGDIQIFKKTLAQSGIHSTVRASRGLDILAACGQLRHEAA